MNATLQDHSDALAMLQLADAIFGAIRDRTTAALEERLGCETSGLLDSLREASALFGLADIVAKCVQALDATKESR